MLCVRLRLQAGSTTTLQHSRVVCKLEAKISRVPNTCACGAILSVCLFALCCVVLCCAALRCAVLGAMIRDRVFVVCFWRTHKRLLSKQPEIYPPTVYAKLI